MNATPEFDRHGTVAPICQPHPVHQDPRKGPHPDSDSDSRCRANPRRIDSLLGFRVGPALVLAIGFLVALAPRSIGAVDDLWITEVAPATGQVEVTHVGSEALTLSAALPFCYRFNYSATIPAGTTFQPAESKVFTLSNLRADDSDLWLYGNSSFSNPSSLISGLKWGEQTGVGRTGVAVNGGKWDATDARVDPPAAGETLQVTGENPFSSENWGSGPSNLGTFTPGKEPRMVEVQITLVNRAPENGVYLTPVWVGFHDGTLDLFDAGFPASPALERLAEDGNTGPLSEAFLASGAGQVEATIATDDGVPPFAPGEWATITFTLDANSPSNRYLSFASMVIPSNDAFVGNADPMAYPVFDGDGNLVGARVIRLGSQVYDAGTEVNDEAPANTAFLGQAAPDTGTAENGTVQPHPGFNGAGSGGILDESMFAAADFTGDGYEVLGLQAQAPLRIVSVTRNETGIDLSWEGGVGLYRVQSRPAADSGSWTDVGELTALTSASVETSGASTFLRVVGGSSAETARFEVTFEATWSADTHPTAYPSNAHFSGLIGATHDGSIVFWEPQGMATPGIRNMAETGSKSPLSSEINDALTAGSAGALLSEGGIGSSPGSVSLTFDIDRDHPLVTLVSMIAPSPDWFVGVHGMSFYQNGDWIDEATVSLLPYDAGTDSGDTLTSSNQVTSPQAPITRITDGQLVDGGNGPALGSFVFRRLN